VKLDLIISAYYSQFKTTLLSFGDPKPIPGTLSRSTPKTTTVFLGDSLPERLFWKHPDWNAKTWRQNTIHQNMLKKIYHMKLIWRSDFLPFFPCFINLAPQKRFFSGFNDISFWMKQQFNYQFSSLIFHLLASLRMISNGDEEFDAEISDFFQWVTGLAEIKSPQGHLSKLGMLSL